MSDYKQLYPELECSFCGIKSDEVVCYRQHTSYEHIEDNYVTACSLCKKQNDEYWDEMWKEYYSGVL